MIRFRERLPHAAWLWRVGGGKSASNTLMMFGYFAASVLIIVVLDLTDLVPGVSYSLGIFTGAVAFPLAAATLLQLEKKGEIDVLRLSGAREGDSLVAIFLGLVASPLSMSMVFLGSAAAMQGTGAGQIGFALAGITTTALLAVASVAAPPSLRNWAPNLVLAVAALNGASAAIGFGNGVFTKNAVFSRFLQQTMWPLVIIVEVALAAVLLPRLMRSLRRAPQGRSAAGARSWLALNNLMQAVPGVGRTAIQSTKSIVVGTAVSLAAIAAIRVTLGIGDRQIIAATVAAFLPAVIALAVTGYESLLDSATGRLQILRIAPARPGQVAIQSIAGWIAPALAATAVTVLAARLLIGRADAMTLIGIVILVMAAPAVASEGWMSKSKTHLVALLSAMPLMLFSNLAGRPIAEVLFVAAAIVWIPWVTAKAVFENPEWPRLPYAVALLAMAATTGLTLYYLFGLQVRFRPHAMFLGAGLLVSSSLLGADRDWRRVAGAVVTTIAVSLAAAAMTTVPWALALATSIIAPLSVLAGARIERRWPRDEQNVVKIVTSYALIGGGILLGGFLPGKDRMNELQVAIAVHLWTTPALVAAMIVGEVMAIAKGRARTRD